jgi:type III restriction enzyme
MKISFDPTLDFQVDAINSVVELFKGQPLASTLFELPAEDRGLKLSDDLAGIGNSPIEDLEQVAENLRAIQTRNKIPESYRLTDEESLTSLDFAVEMETGTGKTYVYLRTALELRKRYNYTKFIVVVPSIAIREGVLANLRLLKDHFASIYGGTPYEYRVYNSKHPAQLREFAQATTLQILVMNIDAFNKEQNLIFKERDDTMGVKPIQYVESVNPIVIVDEPQNMSSEAAKAALARLRPLATLRYSATHRELNNLVYRLTPVDAYRKNLVKHIKVWSVLADENLNKPFIQVLSVSATKKSVSATALIDVSHEGSVSRKKVSLKADASGTLPDLFELSGSRDVYKGYAVEDILRSPDRVVFGNGEVIEVGEAYGTDKEAIQKVAIETAIQQALQTELELHNAHAAGRIAGRIKPLTLFFIDKVANYHPTDSKFRKWFNDEYERLRIRKDYKKLNLPPVDEVQGGYFAVSSDSASKGQPKDSSENQTTKDDARAYELIMQRKDLLMSADEPMRFIWSHSALREGWDNPNVFTIATLNETKSTMKKRQEIGRGLRIPVMSNGERCQDHELNSLTVVANESYDDFASQLQKEIEDETSTTFEKSNIKNKRSVRKVSLKDAAKIDPDFQELWKQVAAATTYDVRFKPAEVVEHAVRILNADPNARLTARSVRVKSASIGMSESEGVKATSDLVKAPKAVGIKHPVPDLIGRIADGIPVSRSTIVEILLKSNRLDEVRTDPSEFIRQVRDAITAALEDVLVGGIKYRKLDDLGYAMSKLAEEPQETAAPTQRIAAKSALSEVLTDSDPEIQFADVLDAREDVAWFVKLPWWFKVPTPVGNYNPDWAVCHKDPKDPKRPKKIYLVRETKGTVDFGELSRTEQLKIRYGKHHFDAIGVDFEWTSDGNYVIELS